MRTPTHPPPIGLPAMLDIEASGFGRNSYPIEIGFALADGHCVCTLVRPEPDWTHWDDNAERVHRIPRQLLLQRGRPALEVAQLLNQHLQGQTVYSDGWANDYSWLAAVFEAAGINPAFKLDSLRALLRDDEAERWHAVKNCITSERGVQRHRASADARLLQLTLQRIHATPSA